MALRIIQSPGVEIRELDLSQFAPAVVGTTVLVQGFADRGEEYEPLEMTSLDEFERNFGTPNNEAERYFYYTSKEVIRNGGNLIAAKLPYNNTISTNYKYIGLSFDTLTAITTGNISGFNSDIQQCSSYFTQPVNINVYDDVTSQNLSTSAYDHLVAGGDFTGAAAGLSTYDFVIVNENKARFSGPKDNEGIFVVFVDAIDAIRVQRSNLDPQSTDTMQIVQGIDYPSGILYTDFSESLTGTYDQTSISEKLMLQFPPLEFTSNGNDLDSFYAQHLGVLVCNTIRDPNNEGKLNVGILESHIGSIHHDKRDPATGQSIYLGDLINTNSNYIKWYRKQTSNNVPNKNNSEIVLSVNNRDYGLIGFTDAESTKTIQGGSMVANMKKILEKVSNIDQYQIDVVVDGGLSTIANFCDDVTSGTLFNPVNDVDSDDSTITSSSNVSTWRNVCDELIEFCKDTRKDCMCILDVPRNLVLQGDDKYIRKTVPNNTFSNTIGKRLRYITGLNSSFAAIYTNWNKVVDDFTGITFWLPPTSKASGIYVFNDRVGNIWDAPAGLNRGIIDGIVDLSFNPNRKASDQLYMKSFNYAKQYPLDGFILEGQKTTQIKPSAFDRVNVRRTFLRLERLVYSVSRYFVYEPNNAFTRRRLVDIISPIFEEYKSLGGINDYQIICDETNNTAEVIERNELKVLILIKPTKTAEFILVDFVATRQDADFNEIIEQLT